MSRSVTVLHRPISELFKFLSGSAYRFCGLHNPHYRCSEGILTFLNFRRFIMNQELRQLDILIGATQYQIRKAQEVFDSVALSQLQSQYRALVSQRFVLLSLHYQVGEVSHE